MDDVIRVPYEQLLAMVGQRLVAAGVPPPIAAVEAELAVEADLLGVPSHGVAMLTGLVAAIGDGQVNPAPSLRLVRENAATCVLDGDGGPGRYVARCAMDHSVERARVHGLGACLAANTTHWGRAHAYAYRATQAGMIGICATNAMTNMLAFGSTRPLLGNNPMAIGVPRGAGEDPVVLDMAMSQAAIGKIATYKREGRAAPPGWGLDESGRPSTDPAAILAARKYLPMGEHKGSGLSLMLEMMTAALAGGLLCFEIANRAPYWDSGSSKLFLALDVGSFIEREAFVSRVNDLLGFLHESAEPGHEILYPGERGWRARERNMAEGVPLHVEIAARLRELGLPLPHPIDPVH